MMASRAPEQRIVGYPRSLRRVTPCFPPAFLDQEARRSAPTPQCSRRSIHPFGLLETTPIHGNHQQIHVPPPTPFPVHRAAILVAAQAREDLAGGGVVVGPGQRRRLRR